MALLEERSPLLFFRSIGDVYSCYVTSGEYIIYFMSTGRINRMAANWFHSFLFDVHDPPKVRDFRRVLDFFMTGKRYADDFYSM